MYGLFEDGALISEITFSDSDLTGLKEAAERDPARAGRTYEVLLVCQMHPVHSVQACVAGDSVSLRRDSETMLRVLSGLRRLDCEARAC